MTKSKRARGGTSASGNSNRGKASGDAASSKSLDRQRQKQDEAPPTPEDGPAQLAGLTFQAATGPDNATSAADTSTSAADTSASAADDSPSAAAASTSQPEPDSNPKGWKERFHADRTNKDTDGCLKAIRQVEADHQIATRMQSDYNSSARAAPEQSGSKVAAPSSQPSSDALWSRSVKGEHSASHGMIPIPPSHRPLAPRSKQLAGSQDALNSASAAERAPVKPSSHDTAAYIDQAAADSGRLPKPPSSAAISSGQMPPAGSGSAHAELTAQSPVLPAASGVASGIPSAAASAEPRMPGGKVAPPARLRTTSAVPAVPSAAAASGFAQSASEVPLSALPLPAMPPATANPYAGKDVAPLVLPDNGGRSLEQLHQDVAPRVLPDNGGGSLEQLRQEMVILKRRCESLESEVQSQKRLRHGLGEVFHQQGFEAGWTENQIGRLMLHMRQTASGPYDPQQNLQVAELLDPVVTAQRNTCEQWSHTAFVWEKILEGVAFWRLV
ncbi:hypothetical protein WJX82_001098 [Trebouxia sp. C0006]